MPSAVPPNPRAHTIESNDADITSNYDDAVQDFLRDLPIDKDNAANTTGPAAPARDIDEEITIKKKRKPVPKLDENLLLSQNGIPRLRKITKSRLKFRGKGHEYTDIGRLLNTYQLWLDDLYPRAKFKDALQIVEKVGHSKRMQVMRKAWLDDTKPYRRDASPAEPETAETSGALPANGEKSDTRDAGSDEEDAIFADLDRQVFAKDHDETAANSNGAPEDDELDALLAEQGTIPASERTTAIQKRKGPFEEDEDEDEDELDAMLAEEALMNSNALRPATNRSKDYELSKSGTAENEFADEEEIMADMDMW